MGSLDRYQGALLGLAVGDALGTTLEFQPPGSFAPITDMVGGGPFALAPGQWTDDTSMALCLAESLVACGGFDAIDQLTRYVRWWQEGHLSSTGVCFDIGGTVQAALARFLETREPWCGSTHAHSAGNGSLMRLAPIPLCFARDAAEAIERSADSSRTTHGAPTAVDACRYMAGLIVGALSGVSKDDLLSDRYAPIPGHWDAQPLAPEIDAIARGSFLQRDPPEIRGSGYVVASLEAALWAFSRAEDFRTTCLMAANLGDDADTTAAIAGQLAGAFYGRTGIPAEWAKKVTMADRILAFAERLHDAGT